MSTDSEKMQATPKTLRDASERISDVAGDLSGHSLEVLGVGHPVFLEGARDHEEYLTKAVLGPAVDQEISLLDDALDKLHLQAGYGSGGLKKMAENINLVENENFAALFEGAMKALGSGEWLRP